MPNVNLTYGEMQAAARQRQVSVIRLSAAIAVAAAVMVALPCVLSGPAIASTAPTGVRPIPVTTGASAWHASSARAVATTPGCGKGANVRKVVTTHKARKYNADGFGTDTLYCGNIKYGYRHLEQHIGQYFGGGASFSFAKAHTLKAPTDIVGGQTITFSSGTSGVCSPPYGAFDRENYCYELVGATVTVWQFLLFTEVYHFNIQVAVHLSNTSTTLNYSVRTVNVVKTGNAPHLIPRLKFSAICSDCLRTAPQQLAIGTPYSVAGSGVNAVPIGVNQLIHPDLIFTFRAYFDGHLSETQTLSFQNVIRCDHWYSNWWTDPGCVFPRFVPTVDMSSLPTISKYIALVQSKTHIGQPGFGSPLHRNTGKAEKDVNRNITCPRNVPRPAGYTCDEYPFASSAEGGTGASSWWVPKGENDRQGNLLSQLYKIYRLIPGAPGDAYYVQV